MKYHGSALPLETSCEKLFQRTTMIGFFVCNLRIPGEPDKIEISTSTGPWTLEKYAKYTDSIAAMALGQCAGTYFIEMDIQPDDAKAETAFEELTPILLGAAYATGHSVTICESTMGSSIKIFSPSDHWPRPRAIGQASPVVNTRDEFKNVVEHFVAVYPNAGRTEKALLLVHHWLDALACWSLEDLYLSATTLLQIIVATEATLQGSDLRYYDGVTAAANRKGIRVLSSDFRDMRNELIHDGQLIGRRFLRDKTACADVAADVLNWFDEYLHKALGLGRVAKRRFSGQDFLSLNAYSIS
jgi:hypothetical protein